MKKREFLPYHYMDFDTVWMLSLNNKLKNEVNTNYIVDNINYYDKLLYYK